MITENSDVGYFLLGKQVAGCRTASGFSRVVEALTDFSFFLASRLEFPHVALDDKFDDRITPIFPKLFRLEITSE